MCRGGALALSEFHLSQSLRGGEAQSVEHPVPSNSTEVTHQSFVLVLRDMSDHFVGPALNHNRVNSCKVEEAYRYKQQSGEVGSAEKGARNENSRSAQRLKEDAKSGRGIPSIH